MEVAFSLPADIDGDWFAEDEPALWPELTADKRVARMLGRIATKKATVQYLQQEGIVCAPRSVVVHNDALGVPFVSVDAVTREDIRISLSHESAGAVAAVGSSATPRFGVDIERIRSFDARFQADFLSPEEQQIVAILPVAEQSHALTRYWSIKEACLKALGTGLREHPHTLSVRDIDPGKYGIFRADRLIGEGSELPVPIAGRIAVIVHLSE
ncbi:MAG: 4-phosphopantetheinyl transferase family protein [Candidatus Moranbacteria bacterium]|nr:4-phosphopantetheinyl transferase family protein [Candidatus Moranbacteria bacterium]MBP6033857.1 4-phosphopantetheinyl transferase family protein [Candidatus Moranbacteria bacterium]MBP7695685.1 4-phosphopantetheinyl transferase family protein [Candidatus Moranbacteria bacterium]